MKPGGGYNDYRPAFVRLLNNSVDDVNWLLIV